MSTTHRLSSNIPNPFIKARTLRCETRKCSGEATAMVLVTIEQPLHEATFVCESCADIAERSGKCVSEIVLGSMHWEGGRS